MTVLEQIAERIAVPNERALSATVRERLAVHLLDAVGAWIAGRATDEGKQLARLRSESSHALALFRDDPLDRIALGVAATRLTEIDDIHMASCTTPSAVVVPTATILAGELQMRDSRQFSSALLAGYEVMTRLGEAISGPDVLSRGIWPTYFVAPLGAAAVTARLLGLTAGQTAHAQAIALTMTSGAPGRPAGVSPRWLLLGLAARAGCAAALAASKGYRGDCTLFDGDWLSRTHGLPFDAGKLLLKSRGNDAVAELSLKPHCAAKQTIAAIAAFRNVLAPEVSPHDIAHVIVAVPPAYAEMIGRRDAAAGRLARITSVAYLLALSVFQPEELENVARPDLTNNPEISGLMARVEVVPDAQLAEHYPNRWPARVEVVRKGGRKESSLVIDAPGDPPRWKEVDVRAKFHRLADPVLGDFSAAELREACLGATEREEALATLCAKIAS
jgi:2-methylcitrate dehydratase PrpD